jgi:hypothetical protein
MYKECSSMQYLVQPRSMREGDTEKSLRPTMALKRMVFSKSVVRTTLCTGAKYQCEHCD